MHTVDQFDSSPKVKRGPNRLPDNPEVSNDERVVALGRFPSWLHRPLPKGSELALTNQVLQKNRLHTVCEQAKCPNHLECFSKKTATFLVLGKDCTRACGFCDIQFSKAPAPPDPEEPARVVESVKELGLRHVVITMVARDDLPDGGAAHLLQIVTQLRASIPHVTIELLTSDFAGNSDAWNVVLSARPEIFNHNIETVRELTPRVRHKATYERTLALLRHAAKAGQANFVKSGIMVGLGETPEQVHCTLDDLKAAGCGIVTIGQYLQANRNKLRLQSFVTPDQFAAYEAYGQSIGIPIMYCGPFVRSSYNANLVIQRANGQTQRIDSV